VTKDGKLLSAAVFFFSEHRAYYILAGNHVDGKGLGSSHLLLEQFIKKRAGSNLTLDFVGSNFKSIAFFYECFGADVENYYSLRYNNLPIVIKWIKG
jgi:hypothetical protein